MVDSNIEILTADATACGGNGAIIRIHPLTGRQSILSSGGFFRSPFGIAMDANGNLLIADPEAFGGGGGVISVNRRSGIQKAISWGGSFVSPIGIAMRANEHLLMCDPDSFVGVYRGGLISVDPISGTQTPLG